MAVDLSLDAQANVIKDVLLKRSRTHVQRLPALEEAERTLRRLKALALRMEQEHMMPELSGDELAEELIAILRLPRS